MEESPRMELTGLDTGALARALAQIAERDDDLVEAFVERREEIERAASGDAPGLRVRREEGLAVRLLRGGRAWLASRDGISGRLWVDAVRQVARAQPRAVLPEPELAPPAWEPAAAPELAEFARAVEAAVRSRHAAFGYRLSVRRHRRVLQVVGPQVVPAAERESYYSCAAELPWGRFGTLFVEPRQAAVDEVAAALVARFRARDAPPPPGGGRVVVLGPGAAAVLLHEAVAHTLEVDTLAATGSPTAAAGVRLGAACLDVLDDPAGAPPGVGRTTDDEGSRVVRRWLLRGGVVEQPLADARWARASARLAPGAARRASRHDLPAPRSTYLELLPGALELRELLAGPDEGIFLPEATRGALDAATGAFHLDLPYGRRFHAGELAEPVGPCRLAGRVTALLGAAVGVGRELRDAGAGWCAKGGQKLPVWASSAALRLDGVGVEPA
jgi:predicted Zn-dependent protease